MTCFASSSAAPRPMKRSALGGRIAAFGKPGGRVGRGAQCGAVAVSAGLDVSARRCGAESGGAVLVEEARECDPVGTLLHNGGAVAEHVGFAREMAGEERGTGGVAERELAVVAVEADAVGSECVDVGAEDVEAAVI